MRTLIIALGLSLAASMPAAAAMCQDGRPGMVVTFGIHVGEPFTESEKANFDLMRLRQAGVDATSVEYWSGCIRAYVRKPGGGEEMQFFDPVTLRRVE